MPEHVRDISEFALIERLRNTLPGTVRATADLLVGIGDDAALWTPPAGESVLVTTDSLIDRVHFRTDWTTWSDLGWKSLAVNISDIAAMGGIPKLATVSLSLTGDELVDDLVALYEGMGSIAARDGVVLAGGDIVRAPSDFGIHVTLLGVTRHGKLLTRSGARPGEAVCVTGTLGAAAAGLKLLQLPAGDPRRAAATAPLLIAAHTRPEPRVEAGRIALENGATAAMDLSDGLFGDLPKILAASRVDATIDLSTIPIAASIGALFPNQRLDLATRGGEDYELLLIVPIDRVEHLWDELERIGQTLTVIGKTEPGSATPTLFLREQDGESAPVVVGAFDHFQSSPSS